MQKVMKITGVEAYNLGTGAVYSVLDIMNNFEKASSQKIPYVIAERRTGDIDTCYADVEKAFVELGWKAEKNIEDMCKDAWRWQKNNPNGYEADFVNI